MISQTEIQKNDVLRVREEDYQSGNTFTGKDWMKLRTAQAYHFYLNVKKEAENQF